jgi:hypothetical protein
MQNTAKPAGQSKSVPLDENRPSAPSFEFVNAMPRCERERTEARKTVRSNAAKFHWNKVRKPNLRRLVMHLQSGHSVRADITRNVKGHSDYIPQGNGSPDLSNEAGSEHNTNDFWYHGNDVTRCPKCQNLQTVTNIAVENYSVCICKHVSYNQDIDPHSLCERMGSSINWLQAGDCNRFEILDTPVSKHVVAPIIFTCQSPNVVTLVRDFHQ